MKPGSPPRALFLDIGMVICPLRREPFAEFLKRTVPKSRSHDFQENFDRLHDALERGQLTLPAWVHGVLAPFQLEHCGPEFISLWNAIIERPLPRLLPLLRAISQRLPIYALSNTSASHMEIFLQWPEARALTRVLTSFELGFRKPELGIFQAATEAAHVLPSQALLLDDTRANIAGAVRAGWQAQYIPDPQTALEWLESACRHWR